MNRGKDNSSYHYHPQQHEALIKDELLEDVQATRQSHFKPAKGPLS